MSNKFQVSIIKDSKSGKFFLLGPGLLKEEVSSSVEDAWKNLEVKYQDNLRFYQEAGLADEVKSFSLKKAFEKNFFLEYAIKGIIMMIPLLVGFALFSFALTNQASKLSVKIKDAMNPYDAKSMKSQEGFKQTLERYRPYIFETLKVWEQEKKKVETETKK